MARQGIRERRDAVGISLRELSRRTGWSETTPKQGINPGRLSIIERGVQPSLEEHLVLDAVLSAAEAA